jgi:pimeloyl-ACP methyl ester carboxylesterase
LPAVLRVPGREVTACDPRLEVLLGAPASKDKTDLALVVRAQELETLEPNGVLDLASSRGKPSLELAEALARHRDRVDLDDAHAGILRGVRLLVSATPGSTIFAASVLRVAGGELYYEAEGDGVPVVLVHGLALDARMWDDQVPALRDIARVVRYDVRGFGRSTRDAETSYSHADDMQAVREGLRSGSLDEAKAAWLRHDLFVPARRTPGIARRLAEMVDAYSGVNWTSPDPHATRPNSIELLETIAVPTTVVTAELDVPCFHEMSRVLADRIAGARKVTVPGVGHMVNMEAPEAVNALLRQVVLDSSARVLNS